MAKGTYYGIGILKTIKFEGICKFYFLVVGAAAPVVTSRAPSHKAVVVEW
jgi:hypothetical protein